MHLRSWNFSCSNYTFGELHRKGHSPVVAQLGGTLPAGRELAPACLVWGSVLIAGPSGGLLFTLLCVSYQPVPPPSLLMGTSTTLHTPHTPTLETSGLALSLKYHINSINPAPSLSPPDTPSTHLKEGTELLKEIKTQRSCPRSPRDSREARSKKQSLSGSEACLYKFIYQAAHMICDLHSHTINVG